MYFAYLDSTIDCSGDHEAANNTTSLPTSSELNDTALTSAGIYVTLYVI